MINLFLIKNPWQCWSLKTLGKIIGRRRQSDKYLFFTLRDYWFCWNFVYNLWFGLFILEFLWAAGMFCLQKFLFCNFAIRIFWFSVLLHVRLFGCRTFLTVGIITCQTFWLLDFWNVGLFGCRDSWLSNFLFLDFLLVGIFGCWIFWLSDFLVVGFMIVKIITCWNFWLSNIFVVRLFGCRNYY